MKSNKSNGEGTLAYSTDGGTTETYIIGFKIDTAYSGVKFNDSRWYGEWSTDYVNVSKDVEIVAGSSDVVIKIHATANSLFCQSYSITYAPAGSPSAVATTTAIDASGITNTDVYTSTAAGSLSASVTADGSAVEGATVTWSGDNNDVATIDASTGAVTLVGAGTVTFTATYAGVSNTYQSSSATYKMTVTSNAPDYAILPFEWEGGKSAGLLAEAGVTAYGLGSDYAVANAPYRVKLDTTGDYIQVKTNERPGIVTIGVKMIGGATTSSITVQESADGVTFTDVQKLTISGKQNDVLTLTTTTEFAATTRFVRLFFTKGSNVGVGPITIAKYSEIVVEGYNYTLATSITSGKTYIIVNNEYSKAMSRTQNNNNRGAVGVTINDKTITTADACEFTIESASVTDGENVVSGYAIYNESGYLYAASSSDNYLRTQETNNANGIWSITINSEGVATIIAQGTYTHNTMRYNSNNNLFSCYASGQQDVFLYEKVESVEPITVTFNAYGFATFSNESAVNIPEDGDFSAYIITAVGTDNDITFQQVSGDIKAGTGLFLKGEANETVTIEAAASGEEQEGNILKGFPVSEYVDANTYYGLSGNQFKKVNAGNVKAGKALLPASYVNASNVKPFTFVFEDDVTAIRGAEPKAKDEESAIYNLAGQKVSGKLSKGIYIVNGKKTLF